MTRPRSAFAVLTATAFLVLFLLFVYSIADLLLLLFISILFSLYLQSITDFLDERLEMPRAVGLALALLLTLVAIAAVFWLVVPPVLAQTQELLVALPALIERWQAAFVELVRRYPLFDQLVSTDTSSAAPVASPLATLGEYFRGLFPYVYGGFHFVILFFSVLVMGGYMALHPGVYEEGFVRLIPPVHRDLARDIMRELSVTLRAWIVGQILAMLFLGILTWIGLLLLDVPYALAFAVFTGVVVVVPFFGTLVSTLLPALFVLGEQGPVHALMVALLGVVLHLVEANFVHPVIMERQVHLPPVLSILSVLVMAELLGVIGLLVAVPVLATTIVVVRRIYVERILEGQGFRRTLRSSAHPPPAAEPAAPAESGSAAG